MKPKLKYLNKEDNEKKNSFNKDDNIENSSPPLSNKRKTKTGSNKVKKTSVLKVEKYDLTLKELAILSSLAKGNSYKMIGEECNIAINTVREHIRNIYLKLNVHSCTEAVVLAMHKKLL